MIFYTESYGKFAINIIFKKSGFQSRLFNYASLSRMYVDRFVDTHTHANLRGIRTVRYS